MGRWFTDIKNDKIKVRTECICFDKSQYEKMFVLRDTFIHLTFNIYNKKNESFYVVKQRSSISGDFCEYCNKCHFFHILDSMFKSDSNKDIVYVKNCLEKTYTYKLLSSQEYYHKLRICKIARQVCDYAKELKNYYLRNNQII